MKQYLELMKKVLDEAPKMTAPVPVRSPFLATRCASTCRRLPAGDDKRCHLRSIIHELLWFLQTILTLRICTK